MKDMIKRTLVDILVGLIVLSYIFCCVMCYQWYEFKKAIDLNMALQQQRIQQQQQMQRQVMPQPEKPKVESNEKK